MDLIKAQELLKTSASQYSSDMQRMQEVSRLITDDSDSMLDLSEQQIIVMSMYRSFHEKVLPLPQTMSFQGNYGSLSRSRDRMARQEFVEVHARKPTYVYNPHQTEREEIEKQQHQPQNKNRFGWLRRNKNS